MERARCLVDELASASQSVMSAATEYASRSGFRNVQSCHFRLEKEMQRVCVAARSMSQVIRKSSLPNGPPLDDRLEEWFSTNELPTCLNTLDQMKKMLQDDRRSSAIFRFVNALLSQSVPENKINEAVELFDSRRDYFHFLLATDVWNCEGPRPRSRANSPHAQDDPPAVEPTLESNVSEIGKGKDAIPNAAEVRLTNEGKMDDPRKLDDVLRWLDGLNCAVKQAETLSLHQPGTCAWLSSTHEYQLWRSRDDSFLWLRGKPGSGKTVLASFVIDSLNCKQLGDDVLAYFYIDFRNDRSTSSAEVMRSLLSQLLRYARNGDADSRELLDGLVKERDSDTPVLKNARQLATLVSQAAKQLNRQPLIVIDALDECKDFEKLLDGLLILARGGIRLFVTSRPLQIIKDGLRNLPLISIDRMASAVSMDIALHVTRELDSRRRLRDLELCLKMEIHSVLCDRADGMFRWVQCQIDTLNQCATRAEVRNALNTLPIGLDETYQRILTAIDAGSPEGKLALRVLVWLVGALRPLRLLEILDGLPLDVGRRIMDFDNAPLHKGALLDACSSLVTYNEETDILILSHFSVKEYLTGDPTRTRLPQYHICYQDAHEHLARVCVCYVSLYLKHVQRSDEATSLSRFMRIIDGRTHNATEQWPHLSGNHPAVLSVSQELLDYVIAEGFNHLAPLGPANHVVLKDMVILQSNIQRYPDAWQVIRRRSQRYNLAVPLPDQRHDFILYILTAFASESLFRAFLGPSRKALKLKHQTNPLIYAAHFGKVVHAQMLLSRGAKVNERGLVVDASRQQLPLEVAVSRQHDAVADLLLSSGSVVPSWLFAFTTNYNFPIRIARRLLQTDEFAEWATETRNRLPLPVELLGRQPPLKYERDIIVMVRRLVQMGLDPAARNSARKTALELASRGGYLAVTVYLALICTSLSFDSTSRTTVPDGILMQDLIVDAGADTDGEDTALHQVMMTLNRGNLHVVKILVDAGYKPLAYDEAGKTPLHFALEKRYYSIADYLLSQQRPAPLDALLAVVDSGRPISWAIETIRRLMDGGADIQGVTTRGDSLLHRAVTSLNENESLEMVEFLVNAGCDPFQPHKSRKTAFHFALDRRFVPLVDYLLSTGRPLPSDSLFKILSSALPGVWRAQKICSLVRGGASVRGVSDDGYSLFQAVVLALDEMQCFEVANLLVGVGCDPFERNDDGKTPLQMGLDRKFRRLTDLFLATVEYPPPGTLLAVLRSTLPTAWRAQTICSFVPKGADMSELSTDGSFLLYDVALSLQDDVQCLDVAKALVNVGCDPFWHDKHGKTSLHVALDRKLPLLTDFLLSSGKPFPPGTLFSILHSTLPMDWRAQTICSLVDRGANVSELSTWGNTLLHVAALSLDDIQGLKVATRLVCAGCDPFKSNEISYAPLQIALDRRLLLTADYLLSIMIPLPSGTSFAILRSALPVDWRAQTIICLVDRGEDVCELTIDGNTLLHIAILSLNDVWGLRVVKHLVSADCGPYLCNKACKAPLHIALERGHSSIADYLLSLAVGTPCSWDVLFAVLTSGCPTPWIITKFNSFINAGADIGSMATNGDNLIRVVTEARTQAGCLELLKSLVSHGWKPSTARNAEGTTVLYIAARRGYISVMGCILELGQSLPDDILFSVLKSRFRKTLCTLRYLINKGANVHAIVDGDNLLHTTISSFRDGGGFWSNRLSNIIPIINTLLDGGCDAGLPNSRGKTPLHLAVATAHPLILKYLLAATASPRLPADILAYALSGEVSRTNWKDTLSVLHLLINKGANVHARAVDGGSLLHMVIKGYHSFTLSSPHIYGKSRRRSTPPPVSRHRAPLSEGAAVWVDGNFTQPQRDYGPQADYVEIHARESTPAPVLVSGDNDSTLVKMIQLLIDSGCDPSHCDVDGRPPIYFVARYSMDDVMRCLQLARRTPPARLPDPAHSVMGLHPRILNNMGVSRSK